MKTSLTCQKIHILLSAYFHSSCRTRASGKSTRPVKISLVNTSGRVVFLSPDLCLQTCPEGSWNRDIFILVVFQPSQCTSSCIRRYLTLRVQRRRALRSGSRSEQRDCRFSGIAGDRTVAVSRGTIGSPATLGIAHNLHHTLPAVSG
ncbi:hypothetical protein DPMN_087522 [Dreissena polymorpha]|uniref:Uncharacterized protein n=1 Tax=Dreissena polymorpha TaxID=45954 RepID=A0A9D4KU32_DREPO|nr:hypothetical protein DPMN_087522 [Dreissena polymorpha]